jgi:hypothetical protein
VKLFLHPARAQRKITAPARSANLPDAFFMIILLPSALAVRP